MSKLFCVVNWLNCSLLLSALLTAGPAAAQSRVGDAQYYHQPTPDPFNCSPQAADGQGVQGPADQVGQGVQEETSVAPAVEKSRKLSRTFGVVSGKPFFLDTRYGRVQVNVWNRSEVRTDVDIVTRADTDEKAQQLQHMIQVQLLENDPATGGIAVRSHFGAMPRECWSRTKLYEVNYTVWLPKNTPLRLHNVFGEVSISGDLTGPADLAVHYGVLRTDRLEGSQNLVRIGNGQASIAYARHASIDASYSRLRLAVGQRVDLRNNYSDIDIGTVQDLTVHSKYGDVALGTVRNLRGTSGYSKFSIDKLSDRLDMTVQYCPNFEVRNTGRNFRQINVDGGYSTILLTFADDAGFNFDVNTQHGKLLVDKRHVRVESEENSPASSGMQGTFGVAKARPASGNVNVRVRYGNVSLNR